jgi:ferredoxin--NADP+ reductase
VILVHGVRQVSEFAYHDYITNDLLEHEYLGDAIREQLIYYPTATREPFRNNGRLTDLIKNGKLAADIGLPQLSPERDRVMLCGSPAMLTDCCQCLTAWDL